MRAQDVSGFANDNIQSGMVKVREVDGHTFRWTEVCSNLLDRASTSRLQVPPSAAEATQNGNRTEHRMLHVNRELASPAPPLQILGCALRINCLLHRSDKNVVIGSKTLR